MKTIVRLCLFLIVLAACDAPSAEPTPAPSPTVDNATAVDIMSAVLQRRKAALPTSPPAALPDTRTPAQLEQAACRGSSGWRCPAVKANASVGGSPVIPSSWTIPAWFIDPANSSGAASDNNPCTTTGLPCLTYQEINVHRWGCAGNPKACPRLRQITTLTWMSSVVNCTDPVYFDPSLEAGAYANLVGTLPTGVSGTLSNVTSGGGATRTALEAAQSPGTPTAGSFLVNTTHPSAAWAHAVSSGAIWFWTQPMARTTVPVTAFSYPAEVNTWANGDSVTLYTAATLTAACLVDMEATIEDSGASDNAGIIYVTHLLNFAEDATATATTNANIAIQESNSQRATTVNAEGGGSGGLSYFLNDYDGAETAIYGASQFLTYTIGGEYFGLSVNAGQIDNDLIANFFLITGFNASQANGIGTVLNSAYIAAATIGSFQGTTIMNSGSPQVLWGPGGMSVAGPAHFTYKSGAGGAVASLKITGGIKYGATLTVGCSEIPSSGATTRVCNISTAAATLDSTFGATAGCLQSGSGSICNY
jgi:hypothetical protein